jgi:hypothetical protein
MKQPIAEVAWAPPSHLHSDIINSRGQLQLSLASNQPNKTPSRRIAIPCQQTAILCNVCWLHLNTRCCIITLSSKYKIDLQNISLLISSPGDTANFSGNIKSNCLTALNNFGKINWRLKLLAAPCAARGTLAVVVGKLPLFKIAQLEPLRLLTFLPVSWHKRDCF